MKKLSIFKNLLLLIALCKLKVSYILMGGCGEAALFYNRIIKKSTYTKNKDFYLKSFVGIPSVYTKYLI